MMTIVHASTSVGILTDVNGVVYAPALGNDKLYINGFTGLINHDVVMNRWWRWDTLSGDTKTIGGAFRPLKDWAAVKRAGWRRFASLRIPRRSYLLLQSVGQLQSATDLPN